MQKLCTKQSRKLTFSTAIIIAILFIVVSGNPLRSQTYNIVLGRPTDTSITVSTMFNQNTDFYIQYGTQVGVYVTNTNTITNIANIPNHVDLHNLIGDTKYYYRIQHRPAGTSGSFVATQEYSFRTQRAVGSTFKFTLEADEHLYDKKGVDNMYKVTLKNQQADNPDFMLSLGDIFGDDHHPYTISYQFLDSLHAYYRPLLGDVTSSIPFYVCLGNHEGEKQFYLDSVPPNNMAVWGSLARKKYYPDPYPNSFYSGDTLHEGYGIGQPENYYSWTWGNALFVVLDVYRYDCDTSAKPERWAWTLGQSQYDWLKTTLQNSTSQYKFVFAHHIRGEGRGGITEAKLYEWGGFEGNGTSYTFSTHRPNMAMPIHQLFTTYGVNIFFQGHDHLFAHEVLDNITYQEVPMPSDSTYTIGMLANADAYTADTIGGTGHLRVTVSPQCVKVDFVRAYLPADTVNGIHHNGEIAFSYTLGNCLATGVNENSPNDEVSVFPNPANNKLTVKLSDAIQHFQIDIEDTLGQTLLQSYSKIIDISSIPNGIYFVHVKTEKQDTNKKVIIIR
ncbi:MAG: T9SS type A sorting domain-containing protein [Bacteroidota bacterium]